MRPLAVLGNLSRDFVGADSRIGGGPYYAARALRLVGRPARIATKCALADRALVGRLVALGVPVTWRAATATASFALLHDGDSRRLEVRAVGEPWWPEDVRGWAAPALEDADWVHVAALTRAEFPAETLEAVARGRRVSLDGQGLVRPARTGPLELDAEYDPAVLRHLRVLKLAEEEARALGALDDDGLRALGVPEIVVTLGSHGSLVWSRERLERVPALPVEGPVDATGAGDAFAVAYIAARSSGSAPGAAARRASLLVSVLLAERR